jgi:tetratricopeptide (TPR) repeat protein
MSLLIKALDHLEKNKQADKDKTLTGEYVPDEALSLELMPLEAKEPVVELTDTAPMVEVLAVSKKAGNVAVDRNLSLEEEAGLTGASYAAKQYAKPSNTKTVSKTTLETAASKNTTAEALPSVNVRNKATAAPVSPPMNNELNQKAAAKVFVANREVKASSSKFALISLGVLGALLVLLGVQGYDYIKNLTAPDVVVLKPSAPIQSQVAVITPLPMSAVMPADSALENQAASQVSGVDHLNGGADAAVFKNKTLEKTNVIEDVKAAEPKKSSIKKVTVNNDNMPSAPEAGYVESARNQQQKSVTLISKAQPSGVDPTLLAAYQAFTRGENASAQQQYRQVLQRDVRNVDALLGMAVIAQRQGRDADAQGWYQKVLEIEPRNSVAQTAILNRQANIDGANADEVGRESQIKSMIAQQPEGANLHATLGNLYADNGQWPSAQEAYFNASRLAPNNADYAFNLAISLDQMGKSSLALKQYQRALVLLNKSGGTSPDRTQLEARIRELQ